MLHVAFTIISKTKGWWVVHRDYGLNSSQQHPRKSAWVPAGCLLETSVPPLSLADPTISPPLTDASSIPILPRYIVSVSTPGIALMDYVKNGSDELDVVQNTCLRILKRYNHCQFCPISLVTGRFADDGCGSTGSYAIKEDTGERGWVCPPFFARQELHSLIACLASRFQVGSSTSLPGAKRLQRLRLQARQMARRRH